MIAKSQEWRAESLGPWERHRRDLDGGRVLIVATGLDGRWNWDLWASSEHGQCLDMPMEGFGTAEEAKVDADQVAAELARATDEQIGERNGIEMYREPVVLKLVTIEAGHRCADCGHEISSSTAAYPVEGEPWLKCGSCASRNPDVVLAAATVDSI